MKTRILGDRRQFAIEYAFEEDPDHGVASTPEESASWGKFAVWVGGKNLCRTVQDDASGTEPSVQEYASWYLLPVMQWFAANWEPLFYEQSPPQVSEKSYARAMFLEQANQRFGLRPEEEDIQWYQWWKRHAFRSCRDGGIFPDMFVRGYGQDVEFSWGNAAVPGVPENLYFATSAGFATVQRDIVCPAVKDFLNESIRILLDKVPASTELRDLQAEIMRVDKPGMGTLTWLIPALRAGKIGLEWFVGKLRTQFPTITDLHEIPSPVLMFGTFSPNITCSDIDTLLDNIAPGFGSARLDEYVSSLDKIYDSTPHDDGYRLAEIFLQRFDVVSTSDFVDIRTILNDFDIKIVEERFSDVNMRGVAIAGAGVAPRIFVNLNSTYNTADKGIRYTLAHEFCHLLHDRHYGREVGVASGPWAPQRVEKRANAFAAMLLMPIEIIERKMSGDWGSFEAIMQMANDMQVGTVALIEHLFNLGVIDYGVREDYKRRSRLG